MRITKKLEINVWILIAFIFMTFGALAFYGRSQKEGYVVVAYASDLKAQRLATMPPKTSPTPEPLVVDPTKEELYKEFASYVKTIFGKDAGVALAVSACECSKANKAWPGCVLSTKVEHSVSVFQINIAKEQGKGPWVHWAKIPGETLEEKQEWLGSPFNATLVAFKIYSDSGNKFTAWSGYNNGCYLTKMN